MASLASEIPEQEFGDVIDLTSSDELTPSRKRSFQESLSEQSIDNDDMRSRSKRMKTRSESASGPAEASMGTEEGEIDESSKEDPTTGLQIPPRELDDQAQKNGRPTTFVPSDAPIYRHGGFELKLPVFSQQREGTWDERFEEWVESFCAQNVAHSVGGGTVLQAYYNYLEHRSGIPKKKKAKAKQAAKAALGKGALKRMLERGWGVKKAKPPPPPRSDPVAKDSAARETVDLVSESEEEYEPQFHPAPSASRPPPLPKTQGDLPANLKPTEGNDALDPHSGKATANGTTSGHSLSEDAIAQLQLKYFPSAKAPDHMCLACGREGHVSAECSSVACKFCDSHDHWSYSCPTRSRCGKCRQLGHPASSCVEKLALTKDEGLACSFCNSANHFEDKCTDIWKSFVPDESTIKRVAMIVPSCSLCGDTNHYSSDCADHQGYVKNPTWTLANQERYVEKGAKEIAIEAEAAFKGRSKQSQGGPELSIRGHAARKGNVHYSESDDSEGDFLGNKPVRKRGLGQIRMASNIQMPPPGQPPLPPGPPPAGPPPGYDNYGRVPPPGPPGYHPPPPGVGHSLPPKPPSGNGGHPSRQSDSRNASFDSNRGGRGGRGGGRGGRGGRGRGRGARK